MVALSQGQELCCKPSAIIDGLSPVQFTRSGFHFVSLVPSPNAVPKMFIGIGDSRNRLSLPLDLMVEILRLNRLKRR
jgi:hypothetical protein